MEENKIEESEVQETAEPQIVENAEDASYVETMFVISPCGHSNRIVMNNKKFTCSTCGKKWVIKG